MGIQCVSSYPVTTISFQPFSSCTEAPEVTPSPLSFAVLPFSLPPSVSLVLPPELVSVVAWTLSLFLSRLDLRLHNELSQRERMSRINLANGNRGI